MTWKNSPGNYSRNRYYPLTESDWSDYERSGVRNRLVDRVESSEFATETIDNVLRPAKIRHRGEPSESFDLLLPSKDLVKDGEEMFKEIEGMTVIQASRCIHEQAQRKRTAKHPSILDEFEGVEAQRVPDGFTNYAVTGPAKSFFSLENQRTPNAVIGHARLPKHQVNHVENMYADMITVPQYRTTTELYDVTGGRLRLEGSWTYLKGCIFGEINLWSSATLVAENCQIGNVEGGGPDAELVAARGTTIQSNQNADVKLNVTNETYESEGRP